MKIKPLLLLAAGVSVLIGAVAASHRPPTAPLPYHRTEDTAETMSGHGIELNDAASDQVHAVPAAYQAPPPY